MVLKPTQKKKRESARSAQPSYIKIAYPEIVAVEMKGIPLVRDRIFAGRPTTDASETQRNVTQ